MRVVFFIPRLSAMSGGLANIYEVARNLRSLGKEVALMGPSPETPGLAEAIRDGCTTLPWGQRLDASDIWCVPESWPNALAFGGEAQSLVYVQSWSHMLGNLPEGVLWKRLPARFIAVSRPVAWFLREVTHVTVEALVPPVVDAVFFQPGARPEGRVRVAWMPRKNRALAEQMQKIAEARLAGVPGAPKVEWVPVARMSRTEVAECFASCHLFLAAAFPEGFGLPPLEAMASGCVPVGFTGFGGWEYMRQAPLSAAHVPPLALATPFWDDGPEGGNGLYFADGDTLGAGLALARAISLVHENSEGWQKLVGNCRATAARYDQAAQRRALAGYFA